MSPTTIQPDSGLSYRQPVDDVLAALDTDARHGLSEEDARTRLDKYAGMN